jgi:hypothetical protein
MTHTLGGFNTGLGLSAGVASTLRGGSAREDESMMLADAQGVQGVQGDDYGEEGLGMGMGMSMGMGLGGMGMGLGMGEMEVDDEALATHLAETRIWGTDVNVQSCMNVFRNFLEFFTPAGRCPI